MEKKDRENGQKMVGMHRGQKFSGEINYDDIVFTEFREIQLWMNISSFCSHCLLYLPFSSRYCIVDLLPMKY